MLSQVLFNRFIATTKAFVALLAIVASVAVAPNTATAFNNSNAVCIAGAAGAAGATSCACPFCSAISLTFAEQLGSSDIAIVAELVEVPPPPVGPDADFPKALFEIKKVLKGDQFVAEEMKFKTQLVGTYPVGQKFLVMGVDPPKIAWTTPMKASDRVFNYLEMVQKLPDGGADRLVFFQNYFEDEESMLAFDAYDEFARAPYEDLIELKDRMERDKLINWIEDLETSVNRRRLYFTMLGVCGKPEDAKLLEGYITSDSRKKRAGLDALISCYLMLKGESGVDLIEKTFLVDNQVDYVDTLAAVAALRFHGTEADVVPKERIVKAVRQLLDRPKMADMIIPDLARWGDWSVMERLVDMFKNADPESNWLRVPVVTYLRACPKPEAKAYIEELRKIDPEAVQRADFFLDFDSGGDDDWGDEESDTPVETQPSETKGGETKGGETKGGETKGGETEVDQPDGLVDHSVKRVPLDDESVDRMPKTFATQNNASESDDRDARIEGTETLATSPIEPEPSDSSAFVSVSTSNLTDSVLGDATQPVSLTNDLESTTDPIGATDVNPNPADVVPTTVEVVVDGPNRGQQVAQVSTTAPLAATEPTYNLTLPIIFIPMAVSALIFLLLWSVVNGWFERLIF